MHLGPVEMGTLPLTEIGFGIVPLVLFNYIYHEHKRRKHSSLHVHWDLVIFPKTFLTTVVIGPPYCWES